MSQHVDFLEGFGDALKLSDPEQIAYHYERWVQAAGLTNSAERIDIESGGYEAGLEAATWYERELGLG